MAQLTCGEGGSTGAEIVTQINRNTDAIASKAVFHSEYAVDVNDIPETYTEVVHLTATVMPSGIYLVNWSAMYNLDTIGKKIYKQIILNSGAPKEFVDEPKTVVADVPFSYGFIYVHNATGTFDLILNMHKEDTDGILNVAESSVWIQKMEELPDL